MAPHDPNFVYRSLTWYFYISSLVFQPATLSALTFFLVRLDQDLSLFGQSSEVPSMVNLVILR